MSKCSRCGAVFECGMADTTTDRNDACWCTQLPPLPPQAYIGDKQDAQAASGCFCPSCLRALVDNSAPRPPG